MHLNFNTIQETLKAQVLHRASDFNTRSIGKVVACDLMSDVLTEEGDDFLLVTYLSSEQVARTADMVNAAGILLVGGKEAQPALVKTAEALGLSLLSTSLSCFEVCVHLGKILE
ncbi:MAG: hypothetical protein A2Z96_00050 [Spirochaetes bacterium GWB1_48_6]|nr:MAG: hypothetical protein A2Z96_00050 [Spirochaetes bacterium GWB1_48_6]